MEKNHCPRTSLSQLLGRERERRPKLISVILVEEEGRKEGRDEMVEEEENKKGTGKCGKGRKPKTIKAILRILKLFKNLWGVSEFFLI